MNKLVALVMITILFAELSLAQCKWTVQRGPDQRVSSAIDFADTLHGWVGRSPLFRDAMLRTTNGGNSWDTVNFGFDVGAISSISFIDSLHGWCTSPGAAQLYYSEDGGLSWSSIYQTLDPDARMGSITFIDPKHGWAADRDTTFPWTRMRRTTDGGNSWSSFQIKSSAVYYRTMFIDTLRGWTVGTQLFATIDGGQTWFKQSYDSATVKTLNGVDFINSNEGWCCSQQDNWVIHTTDGGATWTSQSVVDSQFQIIASGIKFVDSLHGWVFGSRFYMGDVMEAIYRTTNGGISWYQESIGLSRYLASGFAIDQCDAWAVSAGDGSILGMNITTDVSDKTLMIPESIELSQNYPNPFNPSTKIQYEVPHRDHVRLVIYDQAGREVRTLVDDVKEAGKYTIDFDASEFSSGVYYFHLMTPSSHHIKKSILIK